MSLCALRIDCESGNAVEENEKGDEHQEGYDLADGIEEGNEKRNVRGEECDLGDPEGSRSEEGSEKTIDDGEEECDLGDQKERHGEGENEKRNGDEEEYDLGDPEGSRDEEGIHDSDVGRIEVPENASDVDCKVVFHRSYARLVRHDLDVSCHSTRAHGGVPVLAPNSFGSSSASICKYN